MWDQGGEFFPGSRRWGMQPGPGEKMQVGASPEPRGTGRIGCNTGHIRHSVTGSYRPGNAKTHFYGLASCIVKHRRGVTPKRRFSRNVS